MILVENSYPETLLTINYVDRKTWPYGDPTPLSCRAIFILRSTSIIGTRTVLASLFQIGIVLRGA